MLSGGEGGGKFGKGWGKFGEGRLDSWRPTNRIGYIIIMSHGLLSPNLDGLEANFLWAGRRISQF